MNRFCQMVLLARGLDYNSQVEIVKELREKDDDFVDALNVRATVRIIMMCVV